MVSESHYLATLALKTERRYADTKYGGAANDDQHTVERWLEILRHYIDGVDAARVGDHEFLYQMRKVASVSLAALEAHFRQSVD